MPPAPGTIPSRVSGRPTVAVDAKTRKVVVRASSRPPPKAVEDMALRVGMGRWAIAVNVARRVLRNCVVLESSC